MYLAAAHPTLTIDRRAPGRLFSARFIDGVTAAPRRGARRDAPRVAGASRHDHAAHRRADRRGRRGADRGDSRRRTRSLTSRATIDRGPSRRAQAHTPLTLARDCAIYCECDCIGVVAPIAWTDEARRTRIRACQANIGRRPTGAAICDRHAAPPSPPSPKRPPHTEEGLPRLRRLAAHPSARAPLVPSRRGLAAAPGLLSS